MKRRSARRYGTAAAKVVAMSAAFVLMTVAAAPVFAGDGASSGSTNWERLDQVLVIPRVYKPAAKGSQPTVMDDPSAGTAQADQGCGKSRLGSGPDGAIVVAGTADCQNTNAPQMQADGSSSGSGAGPDSTEQAASATAATAPGPDLGEPEGSGPMVGTIDDYRQQREEAEVSITAGVAVPMPPAVVVAPPLVPYYWPHTNMEPAAPATHVYVPQQNFPRVPLATWMPQPTAPMTVAPPAWMPRPSIPMVAARPPIFIPRAVGSYGASPGFVGIGGWRGR